MTVPKNTEKDTNIDIATEKVGTDSVDVKTLESTTETTETPAKSFLDHVKDSAEDNDELYRLLAQ